MVLAQFATWPLLVVHAGFVFPAEVCLVCFSFPFRSERSTPRRGARPNLLMSSTPMASECAAPGPDPPLGMQLLITRSTHPIQDGSDQANTDGPDAGIAQCAQQFGALDGAPDLHDGFGDDQAGQQGGAAGQLLLSRAVPAPRAPVDVGAQAAGGGVEVEGLRGERRAGRWGEEEERAGQAGWEEGQQ